MHEVADLNDRSLHLLKTLVENYIAEGQPMGSKRLAQVSGLDLSPATIRNVMADLERMGLITSPHTSAGRVPTEKAYRLFVNKLVRVEKLTPPLIERLKQELRFESNTQALMASASDLLSDLTHMASIVMLPKRDHLALRRVEFLPLSESQVLAVLIFNESEVENRIFRTSKTYTESELQQAANYLNASIAGRDVNTVRHNLLKEIRQARQEVNEFVAALLEMTERVVTDAIEHDYLVAGQSNLLALAEETDLERIRQLFEAFNRKQDILELLDQCLLAESSQVFIGSESGYQALADCSVVTAPYSVDGEVVGVLGVIGPTRMPYDKVIPVVDVTAKLLGSALQLKQ